MSAEVSPELVDHLIELYCQWRSHCWDVRGAYERFDAASAEDRVLAYAAYRAALDREEAAAGAYAEQLMRVTAAATQTAPEATIRCRSDRARARTGRARRGS